MESFALLITFFFPSVIPLAYKYSFVLAYRFFLGLQIHPILSHS